MRHQNLFPEHLFLNAFTITCTVNFKFLEHLFSAPPLNVQNQSLKVVLHKIALKNFTKFTAKHLSRTRLPDPLIFTKLQFISQQRDKKGLQ